MTEITERYVLYCNIFLKYLFFSEEICYHNRHKIIVALFFKILFFHDLTLQKYIELLSFCLDSWFLLFSIDFHQKLCKCSLESKYRLLAPLFYLCKENSYQVKNIKIFEYHKHLTSVSRNIKNNLF